MIQKIKINKFENNLLEHFRFYNKECNKIIIKSLTNDYIRNFNDIKYLFKYLLKDYNTIIVIDEKEKINDISKNKYCPTYTTFSVEKENKIFNQMLNITPIYLLKFKNYEELKSFELYLDDNNITIYTKLKEQY